MFNSFIDASLILKHLGRINQQPEISIPTTTLVFPAIKAVRDDVLAKVEKAGVNNLKAFPVEGTTRQSLFVRKKDEPEKVISFCTQTGEIEDTNQLPNINPQTGFIVINNEPPDGQTFDEIARHYEKATKIWAVGSQQITQGFSSNISFLSHCDTITLNLDELVLWIRSHTKKNFLKTQKKELKPRKGVLTLSIKKDLEPVPYL